MSRARCLCGAVTWEIDGPLQFMSHCHCAHCRKAHGAAFATAVAGPADRFRLQGTDGGRGIAIVPMGTLDDDPGIRPQYHIFVGSKAPWYTIADRLPQYAEYAPS